MVYLLLMIPGILVSACVLFITIKLVGLKGYDFIDGIKLATILAIINSVASLANMLFGAEIGVVVGLGAIVGAAYATRWYLDVELNRAFAIVLLPLLPFVLLAIFV